MLPGGGEREDSEDYRGEKKTAGGHGRIYYLDSVRDS